MRNVRRWRTTFAHVYSIGFAFEKTVYSAVSWKRRDLRMQTTGLMKPQQRWRGSCINRLKWAHLVSGSSQVVQCGIWNTLEDTYHKGGIFATLVHYSVSLTFLKNFIFQGIPVIQNTARNNTQKSAKKLFDDDFFYDEIFYED